MAYDPKEEFTLINDILTEDRVKGIDKNLKKTLKVVRTHVLQIGPLLSTRGPSKKIPFGKTYEEDFIESTGTKYRDITKILKRSDAVDNTFKIASNPFYTYSAVMIHHHRKQKTMINKTEVAKTLTMYMALRVYKTAMSTYFPNVEPREDVMDYTISNLPSNRFNIRKYGTVFNTLMYIASDHYDSFGPVIDSGTDYNTLYYVSNLYTRIKQMVRLIADAFYKDNEAGKSETIDKHVSVNGEGKAYMTDDVTSISNLIEINSKKIAKKLVSDRNPNPVVLKQACNTADVSYSKMHIAISKMLDARAPEFEKLIKVILSYYFTGGGKTIKSAKFPTTMILMYKISYTRDENILEIRKLLISMMEQYSAEYRTVSRVGTLINYRKALFLYVVLQCSNLS